MMVTATPSLTSPPSKSRRKKSNRCYRTIFLMNLLLLRSRLPRWSLRRSKGRGRVLACMCVNFRGVVNTYVSEGRGCMFRIVSATAGIGFGVLSVALIRRVARPNSFSAVAAVPAQDARHSEALLETP